MGQYAPWLYSLLKVKLPALEEHVQGGPRVVDGGHGESRGVFLYVCV